MNKYNNLYLENLKNDILKMSIIEWNNILDIIKDENIPYTKNNNGVFINMSDLKESTIVSIKKIIDYHKTITINNSNREETLKLIYK